MNASVPRTFALLLIAALALAVAAAPASGAKRARCAVKRSKTVAKDAQVRL